MVKPHIRRVESNDIPFDLSFMLLHEVPGRYNPSIYPSVSSISHLTRPQSCVSKLGKRRTFLSQGLTRAILVSSTRPLALFFDLADGSFVPVGFAEYGRGGLHGEDGSAACRDYDAFEVWAG